MREITAGSKRVQEGRHASGDDDHEHTGVDQAHADLAHQARSDRVGHVLSSYKFNQPGED